MECLPCARGLGRSPRRVHAVLSSVARVELGEREVAWIVGPAQPVAGRRVAARSSAAHRTHDRHSHGDQDRDGEDAAIKHHGRAEAAACNAACFFSLPASGERRDASKSATKRTLGKCYLPTSARYETGTQERRLPTYPLRSRCDLDKTDYRKRGLAALGPTYLPPPVHTVQSYVGLIYLSRQRQRRCTVLAQHTFSRAFPPIVPSSV